MQNGDVVLTFDGKPVADNRALPRMVADAPIGKTVNVEIMRSGQKRTLPITVQRLQDDQKVASAEPETSKQKSAPRGARADQSRHDARRRSPVNRAGAIVSTTRCRAWS